MTEISNSENTEKRISKRKYYLVDYDSVGQNGLDGIENLYEEDEVMIFYIAGNGSIELSFFEKIHSTKAKIKLQKLHDESCFNCLFSSYLGYIMGMNRNTECHIISDDEDFEFLKNFWTEKDIKIKISSDIKESEDEEAVEEFSGDLDIELGEEFRGL